MESAVWWQIPESACHSQNPEAHLDLLSSDPHSLAIRRKMEMKLLLCVLSSISVVAIASWNTLNCPAPRSPENGLSFIFSPGDRVQFRCHPGYLMIGQAVAYCINNNWTYAGPECVPIKKRHYKNYMDNKNYHYRHPTKEPKRKDEPRELFNWGNQVTAVYGDGPRRLPLINGMWPPKEQAERVLALGPQSTPGPSTMIKEEIDIAELRNWQLEELKRERLKEDMHLGKRRQGGKRNQNSVLDHDPSVRDTVISLGTTEDGQALSVAFAKPKEGVLKHPHRHHKGGKKRKHNKKKAHQDKNGYSNFLTSRTSRVNSGGVYPYDTGYQSPPYKVTEDVAELRRRPVEQVNNSHHAESLAGYDTSCVESMYRREVPKIAPQAPNAFVYRYETRKNKLYPFNNYMVVKYKCLSGFVFESHGHTLYCKSGSWSGKVPRCVQSSDAA